MAPRSTAKRDIVEIFGLPSSSPKLKAAFRSSTCPYVQKRCSKFLEGEPSGVCAVSSGNSRDAVIVCPNRLYGDRWATLRAAALETFGAARFIAGGTKAELSKALREGEGPAVVAFGQNSGSEVQVSGASKLSFDWILQHYDDRLRPTGFIGIEVQSMDITGNYRDTWRAYRDGISEIPQSQHGINWANVHKRLVPQLIRKGNLIAVTPNSKGLFFIVPELVYRKFEDVMGFIQPCGRLGADVLSVRTYAPDATTASGVRLVRGIDLSVAEVALAYYGAVDEKARDKLAKMIPALL